MNPKVLSFIVAAIAYGVTLVVANLVLEGMHIGWLWGLVAVALFTVTITLLRPVVSRFLGKHVHGWTWVLGLVTVLGSLVVTTLLSPSSGFDIDGFWTWVWATLIVWVGTIVYDLVDEKAVATAASHVDRYQQRPGATPPTPAAPA
ncbi:MULTISPECIES: class I adenylate-forming enzyme family protein [Oerskovia]|uniref:Phage holin family protein n=1 Tax=Oerskovia merdavium TaxID=2762227 RepID=A0ABR8TUJ9_9CELL|nr:phage holin family protein [Oerskovia merdavium]MBD7979461.1 phage holin family protein [Oerskovia merdavium]